MDIFDIPKVLDEVKPYLELVLEEAEGRYYSYGEQYMNDQDQETIDKINSLLRDIDEIISDLK